MDRIWHVIETTDIDMADASERVLELRDRKEFLEQAIEDESELLAERRRFLDRIDTIKRYAAEMGEFLRASELTETRSFIRSFVQQISVTPGKAVIEYTIPMPEDAPRGAAEWSELALERPFLPATQIGQPKPMNPYEISVANVSQPGASVGIPHSVGGVHVRQRSSIAG